MRLFRIESKFSYSQHNIFITKLRGYTLYLKYYLFTNFYT